MTFSTSPLTPVHCAHDLARRLGGILLGLAAVVARRFLKQPRLVALIVPLWRRLTRIVGRFERALVPQVRVRKAGTGGGSGRRAPGLQLPSGRGWLVRELGHEAAGYGLQLAHLLAEPEMQALLAAMPGVGLVLRPVCRMLGYDLAAVTTMVAPLAVVAAAPAPRVWAAGDSADLAGVSGVNFGLATII
ncbi:MAG: hypothetical protein H7251_14380 [Acetobacteraceae bacterium]|nr:hypothetical protein [Acetobacteraceae bacterium]